MLRCTDTYRDTQIHMYAGALRAAWGALRGVGGGGGVAGAFDPKPGILPRQNDHFWKIFVALVK